MKTGILLCGHGSRTTEGTAAFKTLVVAMKKRFSDTEVDYGFLEFNHPVYEAAVERMYAKGIRLIYALPVILFAGAHAKNDIPFELNTIQSYYSDLKIKMAGPIGVSAHLLRLAEKRICALESEIGNVERKKTALLVVGRGTTDPDANSDVHKLAAMLSEGMGFGYVQVAYSGTAYPDVTQGLEWVKNVGFTRVLVMPFFFFTGILLKRIESKVTEFASTNGLDAHCAEAFGIDPFILDAFEERLEEVKNGNANMNCQLCKYRQQVVGFESAVGQAQIGHHLNVKGILFEEEEKVGGKNGFTAKIKKLLGV